MEIPVSTLRTALEAGTSLEEGLAQLQTLGATPVEAIMAIREVQGVSLAEAKETFSASPAWAKEARAGDALHEEVIAVLQKSKP